MKALYFTLLFIGMSFSAISQNIQYEFQMRFLRLEK